MTRWRGRWLLVVSAIHTAFAFVVFRAPLVSMAREGMFDTVREDPLRGAVAWFVLFGGAVAIAALAVDQLERERRSLRALGVAVFALFVLGVLWMPASGFWLVLPAAISMVMDRSHREGLAT